MLYIICPTCNRLLADKMIVYENGIKSIQDDPKLNDDQKYQEKIKLINSLGIPEDRYCCKMRLMTYRDLVKIVK
jgi:DNA-directed RNA polymerase subunit N (RpoN/RPB10)